MADGTVAVLESTDPAAKKIDNEQLVVGANTVQRQRVAVPDGADVALGSTADADTASTAIGLLKKIKALLTGTIAVSGTFWQATQPVSGTVSVNALPAGANNIGDVDVLTLPALAAGANVVGGVTQSGTWTVQPGNTPNTTPWLVKDKTDDGLQQVMCSWEEMAGTAAAESALTNATFRTENLVALGAGNQYTVPAAKRLRITEVHVYVKATSTVNNLARFRLRAHASAVTNASPPVFDAVTALDAPGTVAANLTKSQSFTFPEGTLDFAAGAQVTFTWFTAANTCTVGMAFVGYLYTP